MTLSEALMKDQINYEQVITVPECGIVADTPQIAPSPRIDTVLIPQTSLQRRISALARQICRDYGKTKELYVVVVLKGAFVFAADLGREIYQAGGPDLKYDFIKAVTYGSEIKNSGELKRTVRIKLKPRNLEGQDILLVDDIVDQAFTLSKAHRLLEVENVKSLRTCALLYKILKEPTKAVQRRKNALPLDYVGFNVPDRWVAGYGIDAGEDFRHLPYIVAVKEDYYRSDPLSYEVGRR